MYVPKQNQIIRDRLGINPYHPLGEYFTPEHKGGEYDLFHGMDVHAGAKSLGAHDSINALIQDSVLSNFKSFLGEKIGSKIKKRLSDSFRFGKKKKVDSPEIFEGKYGPSNRQHGSFQTNIIDSLIKSQMGGGNLEDLLQLSLSTKIGKDKGTQFNIGGGKGEFGLNISKLF